MGWVQKEGLVWRLTQDGNVVYEIGHISDRGFNTLFFLMGDEEGEWTRQKIEESGESFKKVKKWLEVVGGEEEIKEKYGASDAEWREAMNLVELFIENGEAWKAYTLRIDLEDIEGEVEWEDEFRG